MENFIKKNYVIFMTMFVFFFDELFNAFLLVMGWASMSGIKQYEAIIMSLLVYPLLVLDFFRGHIGKKARQVVAFCCLILFLYLLTSLFYDVVPKNYISYLYLFCAECIPAAYLGTKFAKSNNIDDINKWLPLFLIPLVLILGTVGLKASAMGQIVHSDDDDTGGLVYQSLSYYMAFAFSYCCYYVFFSGSKKTRINKIVKVVLSLLIFYTAIVCMISGGRGAFLAMIVYVVFVFYLFLKKFKLGLLSLLFITAIVIFATISIISYFDVMDSAGMSRVQSSLTQDESRADKYMNAYDAFISSPVWGNGVGSIWWTVGVYSHNMFLDMLSEVGLIGTTFLIVILCGSSIKLFRVSLKNDSCILIMMVFIGNLIHNFFSGYWIASMKLFFVCSFIYCLSQNTIKNFVNNNMRHSKLDVIGKKV